MPLAPRLPRQRMPAGPEPRKASMSRTGMLLPANRMAPSGRTAPRPAKTWPSKGSSRLSSQAPVAAAAADSAARQEASQPSGDGGLASLAG